MNGVDLTQLVDGGRARVVEIRASPGMARRLDALGIAPGQMLTKIRSFFRKGPIVLEIRAGRLALGRGMASRVIVEPLGP